MVKDAAPLSDAYAHPRLAATYDAINPPEGDYDFYVRLAGDKPLTWSGGFGYRRRGSSTM